MCFVVMSAPSSSSSQFKTVLKYLRIESCLTFTDEWFTACYDWIKKSHSASQLTDTFVQNHVYLQWLDSNLEYMESMCLPPNLKQQRNNSLTGNYTLQINWLQDIGESAFSQYSKIKKLENENTHVEATDSTFVAAWQPKPRRCLYLSLTDGCQKIHALEIEPIQTLSLAVKPGSKIFIYGPVDCRGGVLHLKAKNVKPLGGEVEAFTENSVETILSSILFKDHPSQLSATTNSLPQEDSGVILSRETSLSIHNRTTQPIVSISQLTQGLSYGIAARPLPTNSDFNDEFEDDDGLFMDIDEQALLASATPLSQPAPTQAPSTPSTSSKPSKSTSNKQKPTIKLPTVNRKPESTNFASNLGNGRSEVTRSVSSTKSGRQKGVLSYLKQAPVRIRGNSTNVGTFDSSDDEFFLLDESYHQTRDLAVSPPNPPELITLDESPEKLCSGTKVVPAAPYQYIKQITSGQFKVGDTVVIKGIIATLTSNIQVDKANGEWKLQVNINDGSGFLIARIASTVLDEIIGFSSSQMKRLKTSKSIDEKAKVSKGMTQLTTTLVHFNGLIEIRIFDNEKLVIKFIEFSNDHALALSRRGAQFLGQ